jgi:hypothetical protein
MSGADGATESEAGAAASGAAVVDEVRCPADDAADADAAAVLCTVEVAEDTEPRVTPSARADAGTTSKHSVGTALGTIPQLPIPSFQSPMGIG